MKDLNFPNQIQFSHLLELFDASNNGDIFDDVDIVIDRDVDVFDKMALNNFVDSIFSIRSLNLNLT